MTRSHNADFKASLLRRHFAESKGIPELAREAKVAQESIREWKQYALSNLHLLFAEPKRQSPDFERVVRNHIEKKSWADLRTIWFDAVTFSTDEFESHEQSPEDTEELQELASRANEEREIGSASPGLYRLVLGDILYLYYKAASVMNAGIDLLVDKQYGWACSSFYHASFFASKAILRASGAYLIRIGNRDYIIDILLPGRHQNCSLKRVEAVQHRQHWLAFSRVLRVFDFRPAVGVDAWLSHLQDIEAEHYAWSRNSLHYRTTFWTKYTDFLNFECLPMNVEKAIDTGHTMPPFTVAYSIAIFATLTTLVQDLATQSNRLERVRLMSDHWADRIKLLTT